MSTALESEHELDETVDSLVDETLSPVDGSADLSDDEPDAGEPDTNESASEPGLPPDTSPKDSRIDGLLAEIAEAELYCANAEDAVNEAKEALKEAKKEYDHCVLHLRKLAKAVRNDEDRPLFDGIDRSAKTDAGATHAGTLVASSPEEAAEPDAYTECLTHSIDVLGLANGVLAKLHDEGIATIGDLERFREAISLSNGQKQWPKGIGVAKQTAIEDAIIDYVKDHATCPQPEPEPETEPTVADDPDVDADADTDTEVEDTDDDDLDDEEIGTKW